MNYNYNVCPINENNGGVRENNAYNRPIWTCIPK